MNQLTNLTQTAGNWLPALEKYGTEYGLRILGALVVLVIGLWIIKLITRGSHKLMDKSQVEPSLKTFTKSLISILLKVLLVISVLGMIGIKMTSFIAILGAAGLAIGMALSGTLQNFAGGVMILIFKPFKVGDFIEAQGHMGTVKEIQIFVTVLVTPDNKTIFVPNGSLANSSMTNFNRQQTRRVDWVFGIAYGDDYDKAKELILKLIGEDDRILPDPAPFVVLSELASSSVNLTVRVWVNFTDYWGVLFDLNEKFYKNAGAAGINIPFPQLDVHLDK